MYPPKFQRDNVISVDQGTLESQLVRMVAGLVCNAASLDRDGQRTDTR